MLLLLLLLLLLLAINDRATLCLLALCSICRTCCTIKSRSQQSPSPLLFSSFLLATAPVLPFCMQFDVICHLLNCDQVALRFLPQQMQLVAAVALQILISIFALSTSFVFIFILIVQMIPLFFCKLQLIF